MGRRSSRASVHPGHFLDVAERGHPRGGLYARCPPPAVAPIAGRQALVTALKAHSGLTGLIVKNAQVEANGQTREFDAMWVGCLADSTAKGKPDIEYVDRTSRMATVQEILDITNKPLFLDGDSGGLVEHFVLVVRTLERIGVSAIVVLS